MPDNQKALLVIESVILLSPIVLYICGLLGVTLLYLLNPTVSTIGLLSVCAFFVLVVLLPNLFFYSVLKNKLDLKIETFLYGLGFLSNIVFFTVVLNGLRNLSDSLALEGFHFSLFLIAMFFISLFYTDAAALKKKEKESGKLAFFLLMIAIVFFIALMIKDFEILKLKENYELLALAILPLFGLYTGHCAVYRTIRISLRNLAWTPLFLLFNFIILILLFVAIYFLPPEITDKSPAIISFICYFLVPFAISCLTGLVSKFFTTNQDI